MNFGEALEALKQGKRVKRKDWGGYWFLMKSPIARDKDQEGYETACEFQNGLIVAVLKDNGGCVPAQAYQTDMLAEDWDYHSKSNITGEQIQAGIKQSWMWDEGRQLRSLFENKSEGAIENENG